MWARPTLSWCSRIPEPSVTEMLHPRRAEIRSRFHKAHRSELLVLRFDFLSLNPVANYLRGNRREKDAIPEVSSSEQQALHIRWPEDWQVIRRIWPQSRPGFDDFMFLQYWG